MTTAMAVQTFLSVTLIALASASHSLGDVFMNNVMHPKDSKQLLSCMAHCVDHRVSHELEKCGINHPIGLHSGIYGGNRRRISRHLVSMTKEESIAIVDCISQGGDRITQRNLDTCQTKRPEQIIKRNAAFTALNMCANKIVGFSSGPAFYDAVAAKPFHAADQICDCLSENVFDYSPKEIKQEIAFENCMREISHGCGGNKLYF